jgi:hypothetical protein
MRATKKEELFTISPGCLFKRCRTPDEFGDRLNQTTTTNETKIETFLDSRRDFNP